MPPLDLAKLSEKDAYAMRAFRRAAGEVHRFWWPWRDHEIKVTMLATNGTNGGEFIPEPELRSLALAVRLVYLDKKEPSSFQNISRILSSVDDHDIREALNRAEQEWQAALAGRGNMVHRKEAQIFRPQDVLDTWLYALTFHQDQRKQDQADALAEFGPSATFALQIVVARLAVVILNLDSVVAYALGEDHRIGVPPSPNDPRAGYF